MPVLVMSMMWLALSIPPLHMLRLLIRDPLAGPNVELWSLGICGTLSACVSLLWNGVVPVLWTEQFHLGGLYTSEHNANQLPITGLT